MISQEKLMILTPLQKLPKNVEDMGKLIVAKGLKSCLKFKNRPIWSHWSHSPLPRASRGQISKPTSLY